MKKGWKTKKLGDVCEVIAGQSPEGKFYNAEGKGMPFYQGKKDFGDKFIEAPTTWTTQTTKIAKAGDILMSVRAPVGPVNFATDQVCIGRGLAAIRSSDELNRDFLFYQLWHLQPKIAGREGAVFASINKAEIEALPLAYPPLAEQQRIVGLLDEAFEGLATAKANAEKNLQNARALFESHLQSVFTQRGPGWVEKSFEDVCHKITDGTHHSPKRQFNGRAPGTFPYITSKNIRNNFMDLSNVAYIERVFHEEVYSRCQPSLGDVLLTKDGANTGNVTLNTLDEPFSLLSSVCLIKTNPTVLRPAFLCYYLQSSAGLSSIIGQMTGAAIKRIVLKDIKKAVIPFPPLTEQENFVVKLNSLLEETQRLARLYERKHAALEALKKSLLHQAFSGEL